MPWRYNCTVSETSYSVPGLERGLEALEVLANSSTPLSLSELAEKVGKRTGEVYRTLTSLQKSGFVVREPEHKLYSLSLKMYELSHRHSPVERLLRVMRPYMQTIVEETRESCHLSTLTENGMVIVLAQHSSPNRVYLVHKTGSVHPPLKSATGRLLLANLSPERRAVVLKDDADYAAMRATDRNRLNDKLDQLCPDGYSYAEDETYLGGRDLAVYVGSQSEAFPAALTVSWILAVREPQDTDHIRRTVMAAVDRMRSSTGLQGSVIRHPN